MMMMMIMITLTYDLRDYRTVFVGGVGEEGIEGGGEVGGEVGGEGVVAVAGSHEGGDMMGGRRRNLAGRGTLSGLHLGLEKL